MEIKIECDNDDGINKLGSITVPMLPLIGDTLIIDGLDFTVTGRRFDTKLPYTEIDCVVILLHREE